MHVPWKNHVNIFFYSPYSNKLGKSDYIFFFSSFKSNYTFKGQKLKSISTSIRKKMIWNKIISITEAQRESQVNWGSSSETTFWKKWSLNILREWQRKCVFARLFFGIFILKQWNGANYVRSLLKCISYCFILFNLLL